MLNKNKWGFTLIELLVTIGVLGILASATYVGVGEVRKTIRDNKRRADLNEVARALEIFKADYGQYPINNYYSVDEYDPGEYGDSFMTFLKEGSSSLIFQYPNGLETGATKGGYLTEKMKDPLNYYQVGGLNDSSVYIYYGARWGHYKQKASDIHDEFPFQCPAQDGTTCNNWDECCNTPGFCFDDFCTYNSANQTITFHDYSMSNISRLCYGEMSKRAVSVLFARLEKPSKPEERINNVFSFCPTSEENHPFHDYFLKLKQHFPRGKDCYDGDDSPAGWGCTDTLNPIDSYTPFQLNYYNYFVPLTGEFNLR